MQPILASDFTPMIPWLYGPPFVAGLLALIATAPSKRRRWWGFVLALFSAGMGALLLYAALVAAGEAESLFYVLPVFPLLSGILAIILWLRQRRHDGSVV